MEEVFGEYILNMSKDKLTISALRGKIKLENVQLDGDLIGQHVMGALGLSGFGVLSCYAKSIHITVPWKNLEKEPTRFEVRGLHLVCVPIIPSTANKMYGAGTRVDPRCTLRTRAKRLLLARMERSFWNGLIPEEGPPMKRITRAVKDVERDLRKNRKRGKVSSEDLEFEEAIEGIVFNLNDSAIDAVEDSEERNTSDYSFLVDDLPELPRDWKVKLREKALRNMEASIFEMHIRCEVSEGGLQGDVESSSRNTEHDATEKDDMAADEKAFALGFTMESFVMRTANEKWEVGSHDKRNYDGSAMSSAKGHLGPNGYVVKNNKIGFLTSVSVYWDDVPPILLSETDVLQGNYRKLTSDKLQSRIAAAMDALFHGQEPGARIREQLLGRTRA
jgi:hypothetical protein